MLLQNAVFCQVLDTNILVYVLDVSAGERHQRAKTLLQDVAQQDCVLTL